MPSVFLLEGPFSTAYLLQFVGEAESCFTHRRLAPVVCTLSFSVLFSQARFLVLWFFRTVTGSESQEGEKNQFSFSVMKVQDWGRGSKVGEKLNRAGAGVGDGGVGIWMVLEQLQGTKRLRRGETWLREANCLPIPPFQGKTECSSNSPSWWKLFLPKAALGGAGAPLRPQTARNSVSRPPLS